MPPIRLHKDDPIKPTSDTTSTSTAAAKPPSESTPQTANPPPTRTTPFSQPATTTASTYNPSNDTAPPPPQPGARPIPPTSSPEAAQAQTTGTPSPPQPGAIPGPTPTATAGGGHGDGGYTATHITTLTHGPPPQLGIPPPTDSQLAGRSTTISTTARQNNAPGPTTIPLGPAGSPYQHAHSGGAIPSQTGSTEPHQRPSLEHPPGYMQAPDHIGGGRGTPGWQQQAQHEGTGSDESTGSGVGETAWNLLTRAGEALKKGEEAAWKAVRNK
ncbi:uncharacterized protein EI97DRAFT_437415 [Westerdykella ornata]|uniref:Uncharacterized protein n=1 Tax=Westerdykella ornata TaxID=318751 RepID=A0A6A6J700_WESOR|nr:uncharacterized protein EI97DRAFT_437415 [Westerdykella ornata]KAF2271933.1 hypothetical protein EI97DRAFT_437415 [Westerdykella ornata]